MPLPVSPTILLAAGSLALLCGRYARARRHSVTATVLLIVGLLAGFFLSTEPLISSSAVESSARHVAWKNDGLAFSEQWIVLIFGLLAGSAIFSSPAQRQDSSKVAGFLLFALAGLMLVSTANDFLALGLSLEIVGLALTALQRQFELRTDDPGSPPVLSEPPIEDAPSSNAWMNWLSSAWLWFGIALLSNATSTTNFDEMKSVLTQAYEPGADQVAIGAPSKLILLASGMIAMCLFSRLGLVPFHLGVFTVVRRQSHWIWLYGLLASQLVGAMTLTRLFGYVFTGLGQSLVVLTSVVALATFLLATMVAWRGLSPGTRSVRDLVTSMLLLQAGWLAIGPMIVAIELSHPALRWGAFPHQPESVTIIVFSQLATLLAGCGLCGALSHLTRADRRIEFLEDVKGLGQTAPLTSIALFAPLASVAAFPWTPGFWGRWMTLLAGHNVHMKSTSSILTPHAGVRLTILMGVLTTIAFFAIVLRLAREVFLESPLARQSATGGRGPLNVSLLIAMGSLLIGIAPQLALTPLQIIDSPRTVLPREPERGSGRNSMGSTMDPAAPREEESASNQ